MTATFRERPEDFIVDEVAAYPPSGMGEHLFIRFEKQNHTTLQAVSRLARALGVREHQIGVAGQKDKRAITRQWISVPGVTVEQLNVRVERETELLAGIAVLDAAPHPHKLRTGHLKGNRFEITLRNVALSDPDREAFEEQINRHGFGNYFGVQRFRDADLLGHALLWLRGEARPPRNKRKLKWWMSTIQSAIFNEWLSHRITDDLLSQVLEGDVLKKEESGGLFTCEDPSIDAERAASWEVSPTGPIWGAKMRPAAAVAHEREQHILDGFGLKADDFSRNKRAGAGSRRVARVRPTDLSLEQPEANTVRLCFTLPKGSYATELLRELLGQEPEDTKVTTA